MRIETGPQQMSIDWSEYGRVHSSKANLLIHLIAVPLFIASFLSAIKYVFRGDWFSVAIVVVVAIAAMALQGNGHKKEPESPRPFSGPANFLRRWFSEQFVIFPLFVLSGRWWEQFQSAENHRES
jgi:hypothetical protein